MTEPTNKELLERIKKIDAVVSSVADELARQREDIEEIFRFISREFDNAAAAVRDHDRRICSIEAQFRQHKDLDGAIVDHAERLCALEGKVFPRLWPTIQRVESVLGDLDDRYDLNNPLDRRTTEKP